MANYHHQGPGPSSYYQQSPPHHVFAGHSPGPRPNYYPYPPAHQYHHHPPPPPRGNHPRGGGGGGGSYGSRGGHHYYQQQHPYPHAPLTAHPYSPHSVKPYSPSSHYPSPNAPIFTPSWQQQPISPLPKQLSNPPFFEPLVQTPAPAAEERPPEPVETETTPPAPITPAHSTPPLPSPLPLPVVLTTFSSSSSYSHMGTISTIDDSVSPPSSQPRKTPSNPVAKWAIWSRRPQDPAHAPSIIISPNARPPPDVVSQASDLKTPPLSPLVLPSPPLLSLTPLHIDAVIPSPKDLAQQPLPPDEAPGVAWASQTNSSVPSSSVTEITDTPTLPGSPASSHTSLSVASTHIKDGRDSVMGTDAPEFDLAVTSESSVVPAEEVPDVPVIAKPEPEPKAKDAPALTLSNADAPLLTTAPSTSTPAPVLAEPEPVPAPTPTPAPPKKSWASLLRPSPSPSPGAGPSSSLTTRNTLPISSVVGFSIPAQKQDMLPLVSPSRRNELVRLLTVGVPSAIGSTTTGSKLGGFAAAAAASTATTATTTTTSRIRPRGLINSGNMCFANSVLQILVYCPPFHRLFAELGMVLGGASLSGAGGGNIVAGVNGVAGGSGSGSSSSTFPATAEASNNSSSSAYPLVDATVEFLREFVVDGKKMETEGEKEKGKANLNPNANSSGKAGSSSGGSSRSGKGKERDDTPVGTGTGTRGRGDGGGWDAGDSESFLPTYIYDAMKAKKRFDGMRGGHQEDAEEFFGFYLDTLEEELLAMLAAVNAPPSIPPPSASHPPSSSSAAGGSKQKNVAGPKGSVVGSSTLVDERAPEGNGDGWLEVGKRNRTVVTRTVKATESPITRIFGGKFRSTLRRPGQKDSVVVEDWRSLRLDIQADQIHTIQDALSYHSQPQTVQVEQATGQQQVLIEALPPVLVLHIKRFFYDTASGGVVKVGKQVRFGAELDVGSDEMVPAVKKSQTQPARYKLFGVLYHHGLSASGGHYTLDVLHPNRYPGAAQNPSSSTHDPAAKPREGWVRIDDTVVWDVRPEDVFGAWERDEARCAYLLFYRRI